MLNANDNGDAAVHKSSTKRGQSTFLLMLS